MFGLGFIFGPALGGLLGAVNLRYPFFASAALALINWLYGYFILPESLPPANRSKFTLAKANPVGAVHQLRGYPIVAGLAIAWLCMSLGQRGLENVWVLYTGHRFGWDAQANGLTLGLVGLMAAIVQGGLVRPVISRLGERRTVLAGITISAFAFLAYGLAYQGWMILAIIVFGAFGGLTMPAIQSLVTGAVAPSEQGKVQGAMTSLISLTNIIAPLFFTAGLFSYFTSDAAVFQLPGAPFFAGSILFFTALVVARRVFRRFPEVGHDENPDDDS
jgi:DHA1 family tetracycline resistance protein-like MFS transporter